MIYKKFTSQRCFGIELESSQNISQEDVGYIISQSPTSRRVSVRDYTESKNNRNWHVKTDTSCGGPGEDCGLEIASYKGSGVEDMISMADVAQYVRNFGLSVNYRCGLHVHVEVKDFSTCRMGYLLARWVAAEPWLFNAVPFRRGSSIYCRPLHFVRPLEKKLYTPVDLWEHFKPEYKTRYSCDYRRVALNLCNFYLEKDKSRKRRCTVEFRLPESSFRRSDVKNWARFFVHLVETSAHDCRLFSLTAPKLDDFFNACGLGHEGGFALLSPGLRETKLWLLKRLRKYQFNRNRQEIDSYIHRMTWPEKLAL